MTPFHWYLWWCEYWATVFAVRERPHIRVELRVIDGGKE